MWGRKAPPPDPSPPKLDPIAEAILIAGRNIKHGLQDIAAAIRATIPQPPPVASILTLSYSIVGGPVMGVAITNATVGQKYNPTVVESNATTPSIPPIGPLVYASDNMAVATVDTNGVATMVAAGTANVSVLDQGNGLTDTVAFTVAATPPSPATALTLSYTLAS